jgi:hypothetical protein
MGGVGIKPGGSASGQDRLPQSTLALPGPPPTSGPGGLLALARSGVKLTAAQLKTLGEKDQKAAKKARKQAKKVGASFETKLSKLEGTRSLAPANLCYYA